MSFLCLKSSIGFQFTQGKSPNPYNGLQGDMAPFSFLTAPLAILLLSYFAPGPLNPPDISASGPLHLLVLLSKTLFLQVSTWPAPSLQRGLPWAPNPNSSPHYSLFSYAASFFFIALITTSHISICLLVYRHSFPIPWEQGLVLFIAISPVSRVVPGTW